MVLEMNVQLGRLFLIGIVGRCVFVSKLWFSHFVLKCRHKWGHMSEKFCSHRFEMVTCRSIVEHNILRICCVGLKDILMLSLVSNINSISVLEYPLA